MKNKKSLGQHWLKNRVILDEIADLAVDKNAAFVARVAGEDYEKVKFCLEIGPGLGTLTSSLLKRFDKVVAVEFDERLAENLPKSFPGTNLEVVNADILKFDFSMIDEKYVVVGNIPYYITSPIIMKLLTLKNLPKRIVLLIQKEVADRILDDKETMLSLFVKNRAEVWGGPIVKAKEFTPPPKVHSKVIIMEPRQKPQVSNDVFGLIRKGFSSPRKKLIHNLSNKKSQKELIRIMQENNINADARSGDLHLQDWKKIYEALKEDDIKILWTDGSAMPNPGKGGFAVVEQTLSGGRPVVLGNEKESTNIRMEGKAMIAAIKYANGQICEIHSDSEFWINVLTKWAKGWQAKGWRKTKGEIANLDIVKELYQLYCNNPVKLVWERGHVGTKLNEMADEWANKARELSDDEIKNQSMIKA